MSYLRLKQRITKPAVLLFFLAPFYGEFLLGNQQITDIVQLPFFALLYGTGALLIREVARRNKRGYGVMLGLGIAYSIIEEGIVDQMLTNPKYFVGDKKLDTVIPGLGVDVWLTMLIVAMHAIWSTCIPILLTESIFTKQRTQPWLSKKGLAVLGFVFLAGATAIYFTVAYDSKFFATPAALLIAGCVVAVIVAITLSVRPLKHRTSGSVPKPWVLSLAALTCSSLYFIADGLHGWVKVPIGLFLALGFFTVVAYVSVRRHWSPVHSLALSFGATLTYAWLGAAMTPMDGTRTVVDSIGVVGIILATACINIFALKRLQGSARRQHQTIN